VSVIGVQAGAARRVMARAPDHAAEVLSGIEASRRQAVVELEQLLRFLRSETSGTTGTGEDARSVVAAPMPSLTGLDAVVAQLNEAGLAVTVDRVGAPGTIPANRMILGTEDDIEVVGEAPDGERAVWETERLRPAQGDDVRAAQLCVAALGPHAIGLWRDLDTGGRLARAHVGGVCPCIRRGTNGA